MSDDFNRRKILATIGVGAPSLAGCISSASQAPDETDQKPDGPENCSGSSYTLTATPVDEQDPTRARLEAVTGKSLENVTAEDLQNDSDVKPILPDELSNGQRKILTEAIESGRYFECESQSEALQSYEDLIEEGARGMRAAVAMSDGSLYVLTYCMADQCAP